MQNTSKRIFFWTLVVLFFTTTPLIIFYSLGYRFNTQRGIFVFTGSLSIKSNPQNVEIYIDQKLENKSLNRLNNSYHVGGLKPGEHLVEVKAPGFSAWSKKITISSGTSTEFWNVILKRDSYEKTAYQTERIDKYFFDPGKKMIAYTKTGTEGILVDVLDLDANESENVFSSAEYKFTDDKKENIEWSPQSEKIIIPANKEEEKNYFIVDIEEKETANLKELVEEDNIQKVRWDRENKDFIYYIANNSIYYLNTKNPQEKRLVADNIASYDLSSGFVYYFQIPSGIIYRTNYDGTGTPEQITTYSPDKMNDTSYQITVYDKDRIALLNKSGELYIFNHGEKKDYFKNLSSGIDEIQFSDDGKKMLYYSGFEISVYYTRDWKVQPVRTEDEQKEITRFSGEIKNIQWTRDYEHVAFSVGDKIKVTEIDNRSQNNIMDLVSINNKESKMVSDLGENKIYFTDLDGETNNLYSIIFPEDTGLIPYFN